MKNMEITIKFHKGLSMQAIGEVADAVKESHTTNITSNDEGYIVLGLCSEINDTKQAIPIFETLSAFAGIKAFSIEFKDIPVNFAELIIPYIPKILSKVI